MKVLVLGGTSFFGAEIVKGLLSDEHDVAVFTRGNKQPGWFEQVEHIQGDRHVEEDFQGQLRGRSFDVVIDNIAYQARDVEDVLDTLGESMGRYILTSTGAVYRYVPERTMPVSEEEVDYEWQPPDYDPDDRGWAYAAGKLAAEKALLQKAPVPYTIIRPPVVLGPGDPTLRGYFYLQRLLDGQPLILRDGGRNSFRMVYSLDLARAYLLAIEKPAAENRVYNVTQEEVITTREFVEAAAEALGVEPALVNIPAGVLQDWEVSYADPYGGLTNFIPAVRRARRELGYSSTPYRRWVETTALWYRDRYHGEDAPGYSERGRETAFAARYREAVDPLISSP